MTSCLCNAHNDLDGTPFTPKRLLPQMLVNQHDVDEEHIHSFLHSSLAAVRSHLGMEVAFIAEFDQGRRVYRYVDAADEAKSVAVGESDALEGTCCLRVVDGRLPECIPDTLLNPVAMEIEFTRALSVRAHVSVPIRLQDGTLYGTLCCFSSTPDITLNERDVHMMRVVAELAAHQLERQRATQKMQQEMRLRIESVLATEAIKIVYQPIFDVQRNEVVGFEALSRFTAAPRRPPDVWFNEAAQAGLGVAFEIKVIHMQLAGLKSMPADTYISINVSPSTLTSGQLQNALINVPLDRIVLEITEHSLIEEYAHIESSLQPLRRRGLRIAVDDAGAGYASFRHILKLAPDFIKLDISLTRGIDTNNAARALACALISFAKATGSRIISEGVETSAEKNTLLALGVAGMQGYLLGHPLPLHESLLAYHLVKNSKESERSHDVIPA